MANLDSNERHELRFPMMENDEYQKARIRRLSSEKKLNHVNEILIDLLSNIVEFRNMESKQHIKRIREYSLCLGKSVMNLYPEYELTPEKLIQIGWHLHFMTSVRLRFRTALS